MSYTMYTPLNVWLDPASITDVVAYIQTYLSENTIYSEEEIEELIHDYLIAHPELIGGVQSVNGKTGTVVLSASDINTENNVTIESVLASLSSQISSIAASVATNTTNITSLTGRVSTAETDLANLKSAFTVKKNLATGLNRGQYYVAWSIGDTVTTGSGSNYGSAMADVEGLSYISLNCPISNAYSGFADANHKRVGTIANQAQGNGVYAVPSDAKYVYISCNNTIYWPVYGIVIMEGNTDIYTNPVNADTYPYNTSVLFADSLKLESGLTLAEALDGATFHVEKDGSGDFTKLTDAITEATKYFDAKVYVGAGTFDIVDELGSAYMEAVTASPLTWGLVLKNRVHIIGTPQTVITAKYAGTNPNTIEYFSAFNAGAHGFTLENLRIESDNVRYTIHDDMGGAGSTPYTNRFINCKMIHTNGMYGDCIGGGLGENGTIEIAGCYFEGGPNIVRLAYYHGNNNPNATTAQCNVTVKDSYFANVGTFQMTKYGQSQKVTTAYVSNCSFGTAPSVNTGSSAPYDNVQIIGWNNEIRS